MIRQIVPSEVCLQCRGCCRFAQEHSPWTPSLLKEEAGRFIGQGIPAAAIMSDKKVPLTYDQPRVGGCVCAFLDADSNACRMYLQRPFECRLYPFLLSRRLSKVFLSLDRNCSYARSRGNDREFDDYIRQLAGFFAGPRGMALLRNNPHIVQDYPGVEDIIELAGASDSA